MTGRNKVLGPKYLMPLIYLKDKTRNNSTKSISMDGDDLPRQICQGIIIVPSEILKIHECHNYDDEESAFRELTTACWL